jgi:hypothetical protein
MQAGLRWRADVFLFLKWVWLSRFYRRVDSGDIPPPVRVLRSLERSGPAAAAKLPRLAPLTFDRLPVPAWASSFRRKKRKGQPSCPFSSSKRRARPICARRQAPASAWGHPSCPSPPASAILQVPARWLRRRMRQASSPPAPSWFHSVEAGERPSCRTASASVAVRTPRRRSRATPCSPTRPNASS